MAKNVKDPDRRQEKKFHPEIFKWFDLYAHGLANRREFLEGISKFAVGGMTAAAILEAFMPDYALAQQVAPDDGRILVEQVNYPSPQGHDITRGYLVRPANASGRLPGVVVIHGMGGLDLHYEDLARSLAVENFIALGPDALAQVGGVGRVAEVSRERFGQLDGSKITEDYIAALDFLKTSSYTTGRVGVVGFCWGGGMANSLAVRLPTLAAAVVYYGPQPAAADVPNINAPLLLHYADRDERINAGWPAYEAALRSAGKTYTVHQYEDTEHSFSFGGSPRHDPSAAALAWGRTIDFLNQHLRE
jgi:carboxymethylenebutenolidase